MKPVESSDCAKKLDLGCEPDDLQEELDQLLLQQKLLQELVEQEELQLELAQCLDKINFMDDPVEQARSYVNRTVPASSNCAPSDWVEISVKRLFFFLGAGY